MTKLLLSLTVLMFTVISQASNIGEYCFSLSLDGKKISHIVTYALDYDKLDEGQPVPTFNVLVFDFLNNTITGTTLYENVINDWKRKSNDYEFYPVEHHLAFSQIKSDGQKVSYDVKLDGVAQDIGGGITILRGQSEVFIDGQKVELPSLKTLNSCPNPSDLSKIKEIESLL